MDQIKPWLQTGSSGRKSLWPPGRDNPGPPGNGLKGPIWIKSYGPPLIWGQGRLQSGCMDPPWNRWLVISGGGNPGPPGHGLKGPPWIKTSGPPLIRGQGTPHGTDLEPEGFPGRIPDGFLRTFVHINKDVIWYERTGREGYCPKFPSP